MRAADLIPPTVPPDGHPRPAWMVGRVVIALERLPQAAYVWDDTDPTVVWDDPDPDRFVWDAPFVGSGFSDAWCDLESAEITTGAPDQYEGYPAGYCRLVLRDPGDGRYVERTPDGRLVYFAAGRRVAVYWLDADEVPWWLFAGYVATWRTTLDGTTATVEAYSSIAGLAQPHGAPWTAGTTAQLPRPRLDAIAAAVGYSGPRRFELGDVSLSVPAAEDVLPIDAMRRVSASDGGVLYDDADGALVYRDRRWRDGRSDQTTIPTFTDNVCDVPGAVVGWNVATAETDLRQAGVVRLTNNAEPALTATATAPSGATVDPRIVWTHQEPDLWLTQAEGNALAAHQVAARADPRMALGEFDVWLQDVRFDYWRQMLDLRLGDRVRWLHQATYTDPDRTDLYDLALVVTTLNHALTPDTWLVSVATSPAVDYTAVELWDVTALVWDDPSPLAVWR